jgi:hypothetical protein
VAVLNLSGKVKFLDLLKGTSLEWKLGGLMGKMNSSEYSTELPASSGLEVPP